MIEKDERLLADFETRMRQLMYLCDGLKEENIHLKQALKQKDAAIGSLMCDVEQLNTSYDNLKFAKSFSSSNTEETEQAKKKISKLVRDVDKCIALLKS